MALEKKPNGVGIDSPDWNSLVDFAEKSIDNHALMRDKIARHDFIENLSELAMQGGFYDIFRNEDKIYVKDIIAPIKEFDDFEDGDFSNNPVWSEEVANGTATVQTSTVKNGSYALELYSDGSSNERLTHDRGSNDSISDDDIYQFWFNPSQTDSQFRIGLANQNADPFGANDGTMVRFRDNGDIEANTFDSSGSGIETGVNLVSGYSASTWYRLTMRFDVTNSEVLFKVEDSSGNELASSTLNYSGASNIQYMSLKATEFGAGTGYFDDVSYSEDDSGEGEVIGQEKEKSNVVVSTLEGGDNDGKVELEALSSNISVTSEDNVFSNSDAMGWTINPNSEVTEIIVDFFASFSGADEVGIMDSSNNKLATKTGSFSSSDTLTFSGLSLSSGNDYYIYCYNSGNSYDAANSDESGNLPYTSTSVDLIDGARGSSPSDVSRYNDFVYNIKSIEAKGGSFKTSGYIIEREELSSGDDDFSNPPVSVTVNQDADIPADEDIQYIVRDVNGSGADQTITQSEVGSSVDISDFTGLLVEVETQYKSNDGGDTPTHYSQDFYFEEGS